jgi:tyrosine-specific transport protein
MNISKFIGCTMMVTGTAIGAGILALPMAAAGPGFILSAITIFIFWALLTITGLLVIETNLAFPKTACSFNSMAKNTLGSFGKTVTWIAYLLLLYSTIASYMAGESLLISASFKQMLNIRISGWLASMLFTLALGTAVFWSTRTVDHVNRSLISVKGFLLIVTLSLVLPQVDVSQIISGQNIGQAKYLLASSPIFLCIFNFHFVIPSLRMYVGDKPKELKWIIILGTTASLIIYLLWITATSGTVPLTGDNSFTTLSQLDYSAGPSDFIKVITTLLHNKWVTASINGFFNVSMTTSFLGVSLGLFDFLADGFKRPNTRFGRLQTAGLTFVPPFLFALFYPHGFIMALNYSACFIAILCLILPATMVYRLRKNKELKSPYRAIGSNTLFAIIIIIGAVLFVLPILTNLHLLPHIN